MSKENETNMETWKAIQQLSKFVALRNYGAAITYWKKEIFHPYQTLADCLAAKSAAETAQDKLFLQCATKVLKEKCSFSRAEDCEYCKFYIVLLANKFNMKDGLKSQGLKLGPYRLNEGAVSDGIKSCIIIK